MVLMVNRTVEPNRVLIGNHKHMSSMYPVVKMVDAPDLAYRPAKLIGIDGQLNSFFDLIKANGSHDLIDWEPGAAMDLDKDFLPTEAICGTSEKVEVLRQRLERGLPLWHKKDATFADLGRMIESLGGRVTKEVQWQLRRMPEYVPKEFRVSKTGKTSGARLQNENRN